MVWFHGGGFMEGSGCQSWYDGAALASRGDIVVVTINYRLGALGWLYLADLVRAGEADANVGMWDQIEALRWVRANISSFGGDPDNVTIAGQSAGSRSVVGLLASPATENLFAKAIALSGGAYSRRRRSPRH